MPSIEIICVDQKEPISFEDWPFAVEAEAELVSHRSPRPLFQADFDALRGCIYHLGNLHLKAPKRTGAYTAWELLRGGKDFEKWERVFFLPQYAPHLRLLLERLLEASPAGQLIFTSDYQFGPDCRRNEEWLPLKQFWMLHRAHRVWMNALYKIRRDQ